MKEPWLMYYVCFEYFLIAVALFFDFWENQDKAMIRKNKS